MFGKAALFGNGLLSVKVDRTEGTIFGQGSPQGGGLASVFDGVTLQDRYQGCRWENRTTTWIGKAYAEAKLYSKLVAWPAIDMGFGGNPINLSVYGRNGSNPTSRTNGTLLATTGSIPNTSSPVTIELPGLTVKYDRVWLSIVDVANYSYNAIAELEIYELL